MKIINLDGVEFSLVNGIVHINDWQLEAHTNFDAGDIHKLAAWLQEAQTQDNEDKYNQTIERRKVNGRLVF